MKREIISRTALVATLLLLVATGPVRAATVPSQAEGIVIAQATSDGPRELQPRYQPAPPEEKSWYNNSYIFAATRGVADSTLVPAAKVSLYFLTVPLDLIALPFAAVGGLFG